jgi:hypothetical protein
MGHGFGSGKKYGVLSVTPKEYTVVPHDKLTGWAPEDIKRIPRQSSRDVGGFPGDEKNRGPIHITSFPEEQQANAAVDSQKHGLSGFIKHPETHELAHGFDFNQTGELSDAGGVGDYYNWWGKTANGKKVYVKANPTETPFSESKAEGLYHNLAKDFFGLGEHLPAVATVHHPVTGREHALVEVIPGHHHKSEYDSHLNKLGANGTLDKLAIMNMIMGNADRHQYNWLWHDEGKGKEPKLKLIDHGLAFNTDQPTFARPQYLSRYHSNIGQKAANHHIHPDAANWVRSLDPNQLEAQYRGHGISQDVSSTSANRLRKLQEYLKANPESNIADALDLPQASHISGVQVDKPHLS